jgi:hypothetical protein
MEAFYFLVKRFNSCFFNVVGGYFVSLSRRELLPAVFSLDFARPDLKQHGHFR